MFDWRWTPEQLAEVADWVPVVTMDDGGGYDWQTFHGWYSPTIRRYFWGSGAGCSCNDFTEEYRTVSDFGSGDRPALMAALRRFAEESYGFGPTALVDALMAANGFNPRATQGSADSVKGSAKLRGNSGDADAHPCGHPNHGAADHDCAPFLPLHDAHGSGDPS